MGGWAERCTVDEQATLGPLEKAVSLHGEQRLHGRIIRDHRNDHIGQSRHRGQSRRSLATQFSRQRLSLLPAQVVDRSHLES